MLREDNTRYVTQSINKYVHRKCFPGEKIFWKNFPQRTRRISHLAIATLMLYHTLYCICIALHICGGSQEMKAANRSNCQVIANISQLLQISTIA